MNKYLKIGLGVVVLAVVGYFAFLYMTPRGLAERVMSGIKSGKIYSAPGIGGSIPIFPIDMDTDRYLESVQAESFQDTSFTDMKVLRDLFFQIPKDVVKFKYISSWSKEDSLGKVVDLRRSMYRDSEHSYLREIYGPYSDFKKQMLALYANKPGVKVVQDSSFIQYKEKIPLRGYVYKVTTLHSIDRVTVLLLSGAGNMWEVAGVLVDK